MSETPSTREVPEDEKRRQVRVYDDARRYIREQAEANGLTYSQQMEEWMPADDADIVHGFEDEDIVRIKFTPEVHSKVDSLAGKRVKSGQVVAFYAMLAAVENGDHDTVAELMDYVPNVLWDVLNTEADHV